MQTIVETRRHHTGIVNPPEADLVVAVNVAWFAESIYISNIILFNVQIRLRRIDKGVGDLLLQQSFTFDEKIRLKRINKAGVVLTKSYLQSTSSSC